VNPGRIVMDKRMIELNVERYRHQLAIEKFWTTRRKLIRLLAEEEAKLQALDDRPEKRKRSPLKHSPSPLSD
jgi:hypothetical protein